MMNADKLTVAPHDDRFPRDPRDFIAFVAGEAALVLTSFVAYYLMIGAFLSYGACGDKCDYTGSIFALEAPRVVAIAGIVICIFWAWLRSRKGRRIWWLPLVWIAVTALATVLCTLLVFHEAHKAI